MTLLAIPIMKYMFSYILMFSGSL